MAKRKKRNSSLLGERARSARRKGERRVARLDAISKDKSVSQDIRDWAREQKKEINSAIQGTRLYSKTGKRYKKSDTYREKQLQRLERATEAVPALYDVHGNTTRVTEMQLNLASSNRTEKASIYSKAEAKTFYRVTQKIWQSEGVSSKERNEAILDYFNEKRKKSGLRPLTLSEIVRAVLDANKAAQLARSGSDIDSLTEEQQPLYEKTWEADDADSEAGSPPGVTQVIVDDIHNALERMFRLPNPDEV